MEIKLLILTFLLNQVILVYCNDSELQINKDYASAVIIHSSKLSDSTGNQRARWGSNRLRSALPLQQEMSDGCVKMLDDFTAASSKFTSCVLLNGRPLHYCEMCYQEYVNVTVAYDRIDLDTNKTSSNCHQEILQSDYVQVVSVMYQDVTDLWQRSNCDQCFDIANKTVYKVKNDTKIMMNKIDDTLDCFNDFAVIGGDDSDDVCTYCHNLYYDANSKYKDIKQRKGLCSDLVDAMNQTRLNWGEKYHCSLAVKDNGEIWGITAIMLVLPIFLYLGAWLHTKYVLKETFSPLDGMQEALLETPGESQS